MLVGFKARNHPQQKTKSEVDDRALPVAEFSVLHEEFKFTVDAAASAENKKLDKYWTIADNGLEQSWESHRVYCNPPFSNIRPWIEKAWQERYADIVVLLLPANRTEQRWWQDLIEPYRDKPGSILRTRFLPGRMRFIKPGNDEVKPNERPPFGCMLCIWENGSSIYMPKNFS